MKATEQYFPVVLFIMLYKVVLTLESVDKILKCDHSNESGWAFRCCGAVITCMLYKLLLVFEFVDEIFKCDFQMKAVEEYFPAVPFVMLYNVAFQSGWNPKLWLFISKLLRGTFLWYCLLWWTRFFYLHGYGWNSSENVIIQMKATEQYFPGLLFSYCALSATTEIKAIWHYFPVILFIMCCTCKVALTFASGRNP